MQPFSSPSRCCWRVKYFCERPMIAIISMKPISEAMTAAPVMATFVQSMTISDPASCVTAVTSVLMLWLIDCPMVSTSLVTRESTSPVDVRL